MSERHAFPLLSVAAAIALACGPARDPSGSAQACVPASQGQSGWPLIRIGQDAFRCSCAQHAFVARELGGAAEPAAAERSLGGATEARSVGGATEERRLGGATEERETGAATEERRLGGATERGAAPEEPRRVGGGVEPIACAETPDCTGFRVETSLPLFFFDGAQFVAAEDGCVPAPER